MAGGWQLDRPSPFVTARARSRAPQIVAYAGVAGAAFLVAPDGAIVLFRGAHVDAPRIARVARARAFKAFRLGGACVHAAPVRHGWSLCVVTLAPVAPVVTADRLAKAAYLLGLALDDRSAPDPSSSGGAQAQVWDGRPVRAPYHRP